MAPAVVVAGAIEHRGRRKALMMLPLLRSRAVLKTRCLDVLIDHAPDLIRDAGLRRGLISVLVSCGWPASACEFLCRDVYKTSVPRYGLSWVREL
jgi:hypothetical protein